MKKFVRVREFVSPFDVVDSLVKFHSNVSCNFLGTVLFELKFVGSDELRSLSSLCHCV